MVVVLARWMVVVPARWMVAGLDPKEAARAMAGHFLSLLVDLCLALVLLWVERLQVL